MDLSLIAKVAGITAGLLIIIYLVSLLDILMQLPRYQAYWNKYNQKPAENQEILYIALGDSTAQGIGASSPKKGYVSLIAEKLERETGRPVRTINLSKSGARIDDVIKYQLPAMQKYKPNEKTIITVQIGANNMVNYDARKFRRDMEEFLAALPKDTYVSDVPYFGGTRFKNTQGNVDNANNIIYELAEKYDIKTIDLHDRIKNNSGLLTHAPDIFHPSNKGYRENWAPAFLDRILVEKKYE